jgi:hypothetical protein
VATLLRNGESEVGLFERTTYINHMSSESIRIPLQADDAERFATIRPEQRDALIRTLAAVTHAYLQRPRTMKEILDESAAAATAAGLTESKLNELLRE